MSTSYNVQLRKLLWALAGWLALSTSFANAQQGSQIASGLRPDEVRIRRVTSAIELDGKPGYEIEATSQLISQHGASHGALSYYLLVGARSISRQGTFGMDGSGDRLYFTLSDEEFAQLKSGDPVWVGYGGDRVADLGRLDKSLYVDRNRITAVRRLTASDQLPGRARIEIELSSEEPCCTGKGAPRLSVGYQRYSLSHNAGSAPHRLTFTLTPEEFAQLKSGAPVYLWWKPDEARYFGRLDKGMLDKNK